MPRHTSTPATARRRGSRLVTMSIAVALTLPIGVLAATTEAGASPISSFIVSDTTDAPLATPSGTACVSTDGGNCTLRAAVQAADNLGGNVSITLLGGLYKITIPSTGSDDPSTGDFDINSGVSLTVTGSGAVSTIIDGNSLDRAFTVQEGATLTISGVTIEHGASGYDNAGSESTGDEDGGAIWSDGTLSVDSSLLTNNSAWNDGGAIYVENDAASTSVTNTTATYNSSDDPGGFMYVDGGSSSVTLTNDTITHNSGTYSDGGALYDTSSGPVSISGSTISSNVAGEGEGGAVYLSDAGTLTVTNSTLNSNSSIDSEGGAIYDDNSGAISVTGSTISNNATGDDESGGAIYADSDTSLTVSNSTFANNVVADSDGGALYLDETDLSVSGSTFTSNQASSGGAIYVSGTSDTAVQSITSSTFTSNMASDDEGGAIYDDSGDLEVSGSTFSGNLSSYYGGALSYDSGDGLALTNDTFDGNVAVEGGAIYFDTSAGTGTVSLLNDTITRNSGYEGGGIAEPDEANAIENTLVAGNYGGVSSGGGGDCYGSSSTDNAGGADQGGNIDSDGTCFVNGVHGDQTGVNPKLFPLASNGGPTQTDALASGSPAIGASVSASCPGTDQRGVVRPTVCDSGAYQTSGPTSPLPTPAMSALPPSPTFTVNDPTDAPLLHSDSTSCISTDAGSCTLRAAVQAADNLGGSSSINIPSGMYEITIASTGGDDPSTGDFDVTSGTYLTINGSGAGNTVIDATDLDRAFAVQSGASLTVNAVTVENGATNDYTASDDSTASSYGGSFYNDGVLTVNNSIVTNSSAEDEGGVVYADSSATATRFTSTTISGGTTGDSIDSAGGVVYAESGSVSFTNDTITSNSSDGDGGVFYDDGSSGPVAVSGTTISNNVADGSAGALYVDNAGSLTVTNSSIDSSISDEDEGGAIYDYNSGTATFTGSTLSNNSSGDADGGALYAEDTSISVSGSTFAYNSAGTDDGGAIYTDCADVAISGSTFTGNEGYTGGAIYLCGSSSSAHEPITTSTFSGNQATGDDDGGGAIYADSGNLQLTDSTLTGNEGYYGGALYYDSGDELALTNDTVDGNVGGGEGGGIYFDTNGAVTLLNDTISRNTDYFGGGIADPSEASSIANSIVAGNSGGITTDGGGDCYDSSTTDNAGSADQGSNIDRDGTCFSAAAGSLPNTDPLLGPLAPNGGPTLTDALSSGSPAIGQAVSVPCPATDQRGWSRPASCDIGAYQSGAVPPPATGPQLPLPPNTVIAVPGDGEATVSWTPPPSNPGPAIISYTVTAMPGGKGCTYVVQMPEVDTCTVTGLENGTSYQFSVTSTSAIGVSGSGPPSAAVTPATVPDAPTNVQATAGSLSAQVSWTTPTDNGGRSITSYTVTSSPGSATCTYSVMTPSTNTCTVTGLAEGNTYTFTVSATSAAGTSAASEPSNGVSFEESTSLTLSQSSHSSRHGKGVTFTATVSAASGTATGTVTFTVGGVVVGTAKLKGGVATLKVKSLAKGSDIVTATYNGSEAFGTSWASVTHNVT